MGLDVALLAWLENKSSPLSSAVRSRKQTRLLWKVADGGCCRRSPLFLLHPPINLTKWATLGLPASPPLMSLTLPQDALYF